MMLEDVGRRLNLPTIFIQHCWTNNVAWCQLRLNKSQGIVCLNIKCKSYTVNSSSIFSPAGIHHYDCKMLDFALIFFGEVIMATLSVWQHFTTLQIINCPESDMVRELIIELQFNNYYKSYYRCMCLFTFIRWPTEDMLQIELLQ